MKQLAPWYWRSLNLNNRSGSEIFALLFQTHPIATLLESPTPQQLHPNRPESQLCRYSICAGSPRLNQEGKYQLWTPSLGKILPCLSDLLKRKNQPISHPNHLPFTGGWLGWLGYNLAWEIENLPNINSDPLPFPTAYWYEPESFAIADHQEQILWLASSNFPNLDRLESLLEASNLSLNYLNLNEQELTENKLSFLSNKAAYQQAVKKALKYIKAGDIFQTNLSLRFHTTTNLDSWWIYRNLQKINPSPFASYWRSPWGVVVSCSPERLIKLEGRKAQTRPIAGTRPRGFTRQEDGHLASELLSNTKERAEHIMLIDLARNDLGKVCEWGSVKVDELLTIEKYSHVMHLVSNVRGNLPSDCNPIDLIAALFPGGTITGCPKIRCMEIIEELEPVKRNLFYGSCGCIDGRGNLDLNILIRTLLLTYNQLQPTKANVWGQVGAGIVADSDPEKEWCESLQKAKAQIKALKLF
jgi:para-aminobenzoate synthetase component 1